MLQVFKNPVSINRKLYAAVFRLELTCLKSKNKDETLICWFSAMKQCAKNITNNASIRIALTLSKCVFLISLFIQKIGNPRNIAANYTAKEKNFRCLQNKSTINTLYVFSFTHIFSDAKLSHTNISNTKKYFTYG